MHWYHEDSLINPLINNILIIIDNSSDILPERFHEQASAAHGGAIDEVWLWWIMCVVWWDFPIDRQSL